MLAFQGSVSGSHRGGRQHELPESHKPVIRVIGQWSESLIVYLKRYRIGLFLDIIEDNINITKPNINSHTNTVLILLSIIMSLTLLLVLVLFLLLLLTTTIPIPVLILAPTWQSSFC